MPIFLQLVAATGYVTKEIGIFGISVAHGVAEVA